MSRNLQVDLFGAPINPKEQRRRANRRKQAAEAYDRLRADHILPIDVLAGLLRDAIERADREWMFKIAVELLPFTSPRLTTVMMGLGVAPKGLQIDWGHEHDADNPALLSPVVSEGDSRKP